MIFETASHIGSVTVTAGGDQEGKAWDLVCNRIFMGWMSRLASFVFISELIN